MNACIRAVVRTAGLHNIRVSGVYRGYQGLIEDDIIEINRDHVRNTIHRGGTWLKTARSEEFRTPEGRQKAIVNLRARGIDALVVIGGDGSFRGATALSAEMEDLPVIGCPGTIDNDLFGTDLTIGYDTAVNTAVEAVDRIRDTAASHNRLFFVEVMGRDAGFIALRTGIAAGAEAVLIPETTTYIDELVQKLETDWKERRRSGIIVVAEGDDGGGAIEVARKVQERFPQWETKVTVLGHIQRGGRPSAQDRILASRMGHGAVLGLLQGQSRVMVGVQSGQVVYVPFEQATKHHQAINPYLLELVEALG
jgi:6-phosphofructokinase 1